MYTVVHTAAYNSRLRLAPKYSLHIFKVYIGRLYRVPKYALDVTNVYNEEQHWYRKPITKYTFDAEEVYIDED